MALTSYPVFVDLELKKRGYHACERGFWDEIGQHAQQSIGTRCVATSRVAATHDVVPVVPRQGVSSAPRGVASARRRRSSNSAEAVVQLDDIPRPPRHDCPINLARIMKQLRVPPHRQKATHPDHTPHLHSLHFCVRKVPQQGTTTFPDHERPRFGGHAVCPKVVVVKRQNHLRIFQNAKRVLTLPRTAISMQNAEFEAVERQLLAQTGGNHFFLVSHLKNVVTLTDASGLPLTTGTSMSFLGQHLTLDTVVSASPHYAVFGPDSYLTVLDVIRILFPKVPFGKVQACFTACTTFSSAPLEKQYPASVTEDIATLFKWFDKRGDGRLTGSFLGEHLPDISVEDIHSFLGRENAPDGEPLLGTGLDLAEFADLTKHNYRPWSLVQYPKS